MVHFKDLKIKCSKSLSSISVLLTLEYAKPDISPKIEWGPSTILEMKDQKGSVIQFSSANAICRFLARTSSRKLYGDTILEKTEIDHWVEFSILKYSVEEFNAVLAKLDKSLLTETYLVGHRLTLADICVWSMLFVSKQWQTHCQKGTAPRNVARWFNYVSSLQEFVAVTKLCVADLVEVRSSDKSTSEKPTKTVDKGKFVELPGAEMGKVVVRFPPEASGFLHIGHAKAALLNSHYQLNFEGTLIMRFDDTNPEKEKEDFEKVILEDVAMLEIKPNRFTYTSDWFDLILEKCEELLKMRFAYVDDTDPETMKKEREQKIESKNRSNTPEKNFQMWEEMKTGTDYGSRCCVRAKIDMNSDNGCLRDPTLYRCKAVPHPRTGHKFKVYPTYDFACPIVDSVEGVTHALRTTEYHDRDDQYFWVLDSLGLRKPYIYEYSRLNMTNTVLSKRKLTWFVDQGIVESWEDPRMPTVRGVLRRGMTVEGLKQFIVAQGSSRSVVMMEWDKIWAFNRKVIDPIASRYNAVESDKSVPVFVEGVASQTLDVSKHPKEPSLGTRKVHVGSKLLVDQVDAKAMRVGENVTFINWGNMLIKEVVMEESGDVKKVLAQLNLENKDFKKTLKVTWVADLDGPSLIPCVCVYYDHLISKSVLGKDDDFKDFINENTRISVNMLGDPDMASLKKGDIIQIQRKGFFICDVPYDDSTIRHTSREMPLVLISIPDGSKDLTSLPSAVKMVREKKESVKELAQRSKGKVYEKSPQDENSKSFDRIDMEDVSSLEESIRSQGEKIRKLKADKVPKATIDPEVNTLLELKNRFKALSGKEWQPKLLEKSHIQTEEKNEQDPSVLDSQISQQGDKIRRLKLEKVAKTILDPEIKCLLDLKSKYKALVGKDWSPSNNANIQRDSNTTAVSGNDISVLSAQIKEQGEKIRKMKSDKVAKNVLDPEIKCLLDLKSKYKALVGKDWNPSDNANIQGDSNSTSDVKNEAASLSAQIKEQGDKLRKMKAEKCSKGVLDPEIKCLLDLKSKYKALVGKDWNPSDNANIQGDSNSTSDVKNEAASLSAQIKEQGDKLRKMKADKCSKDVLDPEIKCLLDLKSKYKALVGKDWNPFDNANIQGDSNSTSDVKNEAASLSAQIKEQGDKLRKMKADKCSKDVLDPEIKCLLDLKSKYKTLVGKDWTPSDNATIQGDSTSTSDVMNEATALSTQIKEQGDKLRKMKAEKCSKDVLDPEIKCLLDLKSKFKALTGQEWQLPAPQVVPSKKNECSARNSNKPEEVSKKCEQASNKNKRTSGVQAKDKLIKAQDSKKPKEDISETDGSQSGVKKITRLGLEARKEENLADWYSQVITKSEMIEYYDVSGCYILRPWAYGIWEAITNFFDPIIKSLGVSNCYFPMFVSSRALEREKTHIADFAPEVAWVTKSGDSDLAEPIAIRPTSETVMYPSYAKWIKSYRDLPLKLNQWCNIVRWEFKHPQPFIRTREILWQEGHTAFATQEEAVVEVHTILDLYTRIYEEILAIPVIRGRKTEKEKFAGADFTTTVEAYIPANGRAVQGATSHHLGQNFSKMFEIIFEDPETGEKKFVYQNSWGLTTRTIGVTIMVHGDNSGLVLPPRIAPHQVVIVPCGITANLSESDRKMLLEKCEMLEKELQRASIRVKGDFRDNYSPGWKYNHWELKGVPIRIELGPRDVKKEEFVLVRRDTGEKVVGKLNNASDAVQKLLDNIQENLFNKARKELHEHLTVSFDFEEFCTKLDNRCIIQAPFCGEIPCEDVIKKDSAKNADEMLEPGAPSMGAKALCIPFQQPAEITSDMKCINPACGNKPKYFTLFGRSY